MSCSRCGYVLTTQDQVCPRCGQPVGAAPPPPGSYPPPGYPPQGAYGAPPGYPTPGYYPQGYPTNVSGSLILVFGILSIVLSFLCPVFGLFGIAAILMGSNAVAAVDRGEADPAQRGTANAGRICGIVGTIFFALSLLLILVAIANPAFRKGFSDSFNRSYSQSHPETTPTDAAPPDAAPQPGPTPSP